jgi:response regulator NasT
MCESDPFDFVVLDYQIPGSSGLDVAGRLRKLRIPFLMLSAYTDDSIVRLAAKYGALGYLAKPVTPKQVELAIETALTRADEIGNLEKAVEVSGVVGVAVGIVMLTFGVSRMNALEKLREFCRPRNRTLKEVSMEISNLFEMHLETEGRGQARNALRGYLENS